MVSSRCDREKLVEGGTFSVISYRDHVKMFDAAIGVEVGDEAYTKVANMRPKLKTK